METVNDCPRCRGSELTSHYLCMVMYGLPMPDKVCGEAVRKDILVVLDGRN